VLVEDMLQHLRDAQLRVDILRIRAEASGLKHIESYLEVVSMELTMLVEGVATKEGGDIRELPMVIRDSPNSV
jgi:hypothetical protein|tara:strand:- start:1128 stop:1346 length:219 start_codon:yes stop_codon:yes gene_type:complete